MQAGNIQFLNLRPRTLPAALREAERARAAWGRQPDVRAAPPPAARQVLAEEPAPCRVAPEADPREAAVQLLHAAEVQATTPVALSAARAATAAALSGDPALLVAAAAGDIAGAPAAAREWLRHQ